MTATFQSNNEKLLNNDNDDASILEEVVDLTPQQELKWDPLLEKIRRVLQQRKFCEPEVPRARTATLESSIVDDTTTTNGSSSQHSAAARWWDEAVHHVKRVLDGNHKQQDDEEDLRLCRKSLSFDTASLSELEDISLDDDVDMNNNNVEIEKRRHVDDETSEEDWDLIVLEEGEELEEEEDDDLVVMAIDEYALPKASTTDQVLRGFEQVAAALLILAAAFGVLRQLGGLEFELIELQQA